MSSFALIDPTGRVCELAAAQFPVHADLQWIDIRAVSPPPEVGWSYADGTFSAPAGAPAATLAQQAAAASVAGLTIALSGSLTLAATMFPTDPATQSKLGAVVTTLTATGAFPGGATSYPLKDASGTWHTFTIDQYKAVAGAIAAYVAACDLIADGNPLGASELPANNVSLAV